jgi:type VI secretion system protein ImpB
VNLPFVAGVLADLSGKWAEPDDVPAKDRSARGDLVAERKFLEIDQQNFNERMKAIRPTVSFNVPDVLTGKGSLPVNLSFESMDDFAPDKVAAKIEPLRELLAIRKKLSELKNRAANKPALEKALDKVLGNPALIKALAEAAK